MNRIDVERSQNGLVSRWVHYPMRRMWDQNQRQSREVGQIRPLFRRTLLLLLLPRPEITYYCLV